MKKLSALFLSLSVLVYSSVAHALDEVLEDGLHNSEVGDDLAEGIHEAEHASQGGLPQFEPTWFASQVFWLAVSFAVLYMIFSKKTLPEISGVIENRKNHIRSDLETAEQLTAQADAVNDAYHQGLEKAQYEASKAVQDVENDMKVKSAKAFDKFRSRSESEVKGAEDRIRASKIAAMDEMNSIAAEAASQAVEKIIGKNADVNQVRAIVEDMNGKAKAA